MRITGLFLAILAVAAASVIPREHAVADRDFLIKQRSLLQLFVRVHQPNMYPELKTLGDNYDIAASRDHYKNVNVVRDFMRMYNKGMLPRGEMFSLLYRPHMEQAIRLFDLFYYANDWDTFLKTACWARDHVNEGQFVYALTVAIIHRQDTQNMALPAIYEVYPRMFVDAQTIQKVYEARMRGTQNLVIRVNTTTPWQTTNMEQQLQYFTEDIGLNAYHTYFHLMYPFWLTAKDYGMELERYGELFYYTHQQLLARYNLERLTVGLPEVEVLIFNKPIKTGYSPKIRYFNGLEMPMRPDNMEIHEDAYMKVEEIKEVERRIREAIDLGYVVTMDGSKVSIYERKGIDYLGQMIESYGNSVNYRYYGNLYNMLRSLVARMVDPVMKHGVAPGAVGNYMTALRDPIYYRMCKRIDLIFQKYKQYLAHYTNDELNFPGVKIEKVEIEKLVTYFDHFDIDMTNAFDVTRLEEADMYHIVARQMRLTYKPFTYKFEVQSDKDANVMMRIFIGPKYDSTGKEMDVNTMRKYMVELDRFPYKIVPGKNVITRKSEDSFVTSKNQKTFWKLMQVIEEAIRDKRNMDVKEIYNYCGYPENLLLPKGRKNGMTYTMFFMLTPYDGPMTDLPETYVSCGAGYTTAFPDKMPMGFPFDRVIDVPTFQTPNMLFQDVLVFHKKTNDPSVRM